MLPAGPPEPQIPEPNGECPSFSSGTQTIAGLRTEIDAGSPGATKGAILFYFHGTGGRGRLSRVPSSIRSEITSEGGLVLAPTGNMGGGGRTDLAPPTGAWFVEDMEWVDHVVACAVRDHNIDPNRIYATGCSAGGLMSGSLGLMRSEYMAAVAPDSGGINYQGSRMLSDPSHGPAAFTMHGGAGDNVIVNFEDTSVWFHEQNKLAENDPYMVDCNHSSGHCGAPTSLRLMYWEFMKAHTFDVQESPWIASPPADLPSYCARVE
jgi:polyhydroxybutyrate depolymerase